MKQPNNRRAKRLLDMKQQGATFRWNYLLKSRVLWIAIIICGILAFLSLRYPTTPLGMHRVIWLLVGVLIGRIIRDLVWLKDIVDAFPFLKEVLDWQKVERLADDHLAESSK